jgi:hypothetical protein
VTVRPAVAASPESTDEAATLRLLFHRLNNQLGIILAHAELLEAKATDDLHRARAAQVVASVLDAMATARDIRAHAGADTTRDDDTIR